MLQDRDYMRRRTQGNGDSAASGMHALYGLIIVNVLLFLVIRRTDGLALIPAQFHQGYFHELVTALFLHDGFMHIFFNMFTLYIFGSLSAPILGARRFLGLFFVSGIAGNLLWLAFNWNSQVTLLGASGGCMGVIMATAMLMPNIEMYLLFIPYPIKLRTMAVVFIAIEIFGELTNSRPEVAYLAHIGGFAAGYIYAMLFLRREVQWNPLAKLFGSGTNAPNGMPRGWNIGEEQETRRNPGGPAHPSEGPVTQRELDALLDKISQQGINALSEAEMERLRQAREQMRKGPR